MIFSSEFVQIMQILIAIAAVLGAYRANRKTNDVKQDSETRSAANKTSIETLQKELNEEREARKSAIASLEEWKNKYAASQEQIKGLETRISLQDKEIADYKKAMIDYQAESQELRSRLEFERELRGALKQQTEANGTFMAKALETVERIVSPLIQSATANAAPKVEAPPVIETAKVEAAPA